MDILDNKSPQIGTFFTALDELSSIIKQTLQNRTPHLNGEKYLTTERFANFSASLPAPSKTGGILEEYWQNSIYSTKWQNSV